MPATRLPNASRSAMAGALVALLDGGSGPGTVQIRSGTQPADPDSAASGTLLAELTLNDPAFGSPTNGVVQADVSPAVTDVGVANGTATWFRALDSNAGSVIDGSCGATGSGEDMELSNVVIAIGQDVTMTSWTITQPDGT